MSHLPHVKSKRGHRTRKNHSPVSHFKDRVSIHQRPQSVQDRTEFGHWECDLMMLSDKKQNLMVTQERTSRYVMLNLQSSKETAPLMRNLQKNFEHIPQEHIKTVTSKFVMILKEVRHCDSPKGAKKSIFKYLILNIKGGLPRRALPSSQ